MIDATLIKATDPCRGKLPDSIYVGGHKWAWAPGFDGRWWKECRNCGMACDVKEMRE